MKFYKKGGDGEKEVSDGSYEWMIDTSAHYDFTWNDTKLKGVVYPKACSKKKLAVPDIAKIKNSNFCVFENGASYEDFFAHKCFKSCYGYFVLHF